MKEIHIDQIIRKLKDIENKEKIQKLLGKEKSYTKDLELALEARRQWRIASKILKENNFKSRIL